MAPKINAKAAAGRAAKEEVKSGKQLKDPRKRERGRDFFIRKRGDWLKICLYF